jgi:hypothetical protein
MSAGINALGYGLRHIPIGIKVEVLVKINEAFFFRNMKTQLMLVKTKNPGFYSLTCRRQADVIQSS